VYTASCNKYINNRVSNHMMRWAGHVARTEEKRNADRLLVGKPEGRRLLGRPRCKWMDNIWMDLVSQFADR
jgi:hypothetical protein